MWRVGIGLGICLLALVAGMPVAADSPTDDTDAELEPDEIRFDVTLETDGSAEWRMEHALALEDEETREAFSDMQEGIESDPESYLAAFEERIEHMVADAEATTGREMQTSDFSIRAHETITGDAGVIVYSFTWEGFAAVEDGELRAGDAIDGLPLADHTTLRMTWPADAAVTRVEPEPTEEHPNGVTWSGAETTFTAGEPRVVLEFDEAGVLPVGPLALAAVLALLLLGGGGAAVWRRRSAKDEAAATADPILTNEERVLALLDERGGRAKQQEIVQELGWTEAKTSYVIRELRETDAVEVVRIGRENVVSIPGEGPESRCEEPTQPEESTTE